MRPEVFSGEEVTLRRPALPTYDTIAEVMSDEYGSGLRLAYWTVGRSVLMVPGLRMVDVPWKQALAGSLVASTFMSSLALWRFSYIARQSGLRKDVPMKALAWLGLLGIGAAGVYWYSTKDKKEEEEPVVDYSTAPLPPATIPGFVPGQGIDDEGNKIIEDVIINDPAEQNILRTSSKIQPLAGFNRMGLRVNYTGRRYR